MSPREYNFQQSRRNAIKCHEIPQLKAVVFAMFSQNGSHIRSTITIQRDGHSSLTARRRENAARADRK